MNIPKKLEGGLPESSRVRPFKPFKYLAITASAFLLLPVSGLQAQDAQSSPAIEEIVVQGTATGTGIRGVAPVGSQTLTLSREDLLESPVRSSAEIIASMPQGSQMDSGVASGDGGNSAGGGGLNLRGLGSNASLMLLDGHRMAGQGASSVSPDPNAIPFAAIERVEVVLDGASSVYGSDAVAGVVNFRMRDDFEGVDLQVSGQSGVYDNAKVEMVFGHQFENANVLVGLSKEYTTPMIAGERDYLMDDITKYGGPDGSIGNPGPRGLVEVGNDFYVPVEGWTGTTVTSYNGVTLDEPVRRPLLSELRPATSDDYVDSADFRTYRAATDRRSAFMRFGFDLSDTLRLEYTGMVSRRESRTVQYMGWGPFSIDITQYSPYYIPGLTSTPGEAYAALVNTYEQGRQWKTRNHFRTQNHYVDVTWDIGEFQLTGSVYSGDTKGCDICRPEGNNAALRHDPAGTPVGYKLYAEVGTDANGNPRGNNPEWYNPYLQETDQPELLTKLIGDTYRTGDQWQSGAKVQLEGPLMDIAGGTVRGSIGAEYVDKNHWLWLNQDVRYYPEPRKEDYVLRDTTYSREVGSVFGELYLPLVGDTNAMPGIQRLALNLSVRRDEYSDFGDTTNPRVGVTWDINDDLSLRASWGTAFRAPTTEQVNPGVNSTLTRSEVVVGSGVPIPVNNPATNETDIFSRGGRNPDLGPETADMWSVGFDYAPYQIEGLEWQFTYYDIKYEDRIENLPNSGSAFSSPENYERYAEFIYPYTQPASCVQGDLDTYAPELTRWLQLDGTRFAGGPGDCNTHAVINDGLQNVGSLNQNGIDTQVSYRWDTEMGSWSISANVAKILELERTLGLEGDFFSVLDEIGWQTSLRARGRLSWLYNNWNAALSANMEGSYTNNQHPSGNDKTVDAWTTFDATLSYRTPDDGTMMSGITAQLGIQNLTDKQPPIVLHGGWSVSAIDTDVHNPFGRLIRLEVGKRF